MEDPRSEALRWALTHIERDVGPIVGATDEVPGTAPGWRIRTEIAGTGPVFLKIADGSEWSREAVGAEAALLTTVRHRHMPHVLAADPRGDVPWMVQRDLGTSGWPPPWPGDMSPLWKALGRLSRATPPPWLAHPDDVDPWAPLLAHDGDEWWRRRAVDLSAAARRVSIAGDGLVHGDLGAGNVCVTDHTIVIDWSDSYVGNPEMDLVTVAIEVAHCDGRRVSPPVSDLTAWLAKIAGLLIRAADRPAWPGAGGEQVRDQQAALARTAVRWAAEQLDA